MRINPQRGFVTKGEEVTPTREAESPEELDTAHEIISHYEGIRTTAYWDVDQWAICYGDTSYEGEVETEQGCKDRLDKRIESVRAYVIKKFSDQILTEPQIHALVSLYYNVRSPTDLEWRIKNKMSEKSIKNAFRMYYVAGGVPLKGLKKRRESEANLFFKK